MLLVYTWACFIERIHIWHWQAGVVLDTLVPKPPVRNPAESAHVWSPDSQHVLCVWDNLCGVYGSDGVPLSTQKLSEPIRSVAWSSAGIVALLTGHALRLYTVVEGAGLSLEHSLASVMVPVPLASDSQPLTWSPDGAVLACAGHAVQSGSLFGRDIDRPAVALVDSRATLLGVHVLCGETSDTGWRARWSHWSSLRELRIFTQCLSKEEGVCLVEIGAP